MPSLMPQPNTRLEGATAARLRITGLLLAACAGLAACGASPVNTQAPAAELSEGRFSATEQRRIAARDPIAEGFIDALVQLPGYSPQDTTLAFERRALAADPFLRALEAAVAARGYGVRKLTTIGALNTVTHDASTDTLDPAAVVRTLSFGNAQMRRSFRQLADGSWSPTGSLFIRGADASRVRLTDNRTRRAPALRQAPAQIPTPSSPQTSPQLSAQAPLVDPLPTSPRSTRAFGESDVARTQAPSVSAARRPIAPSPAGSQAGDAQVPKNVAEIGASNYSGLFEGYDNVEELVLVFDNDSLVLGPENKRRIRDALASANTDLDLFSIIGCSFGPTRLENGNELLAIGRANRVKEELIFAGVPRERILDEGCWAGSHEASFPARGVVLTVKRSLG